MNYNIEDNTLQKAQGKVKNIRIVYKPNIESRVDGLSIEIKFSFAYVYLFRIDDYPFAFISERLISLEKGDAVSIIFYEEETIQPFEVREITNHSTYGTIYECLG